MLQIAKGFSGYLTSARSKAPGIVLLQEIFGVNESIRAAADRFAKDGFTVLAPDLFWRLEPGLQLGYSDADLKRGRSLYQQLDIDLAVKDIGEVIAVLKAQESCTGSVAVVGFCLGGHLAYLSAANYPIGAAVCFYGVNLPKVLDKRSSIRCPILFHFGAEDQHIPSADLEQVERAFAERKGTQVCVYEGAGHAFYNSFRAEYRKEAAELAHQRTVDFLHEVL